MDEKFMTRTVSFDEGTWSRLEEMAKKSDRSVSAMVRVCINAMWERQPQEGEWQRGQPANPYVAATD